MGKTENLGPLLREKLERTEGDPRVIVRIKDNISTSSVVGTLEQTGASLLRTEPNLGFVVMDAMPDEIDRLQEKDQVEQVELDAEVSIQDGSDNPFRKEGGLPAQDAEAASSKRTVTEAKTQINVQRAFDRGLKGEGTSVAVLDTGVNSNHPALKGQVTEEVGIADGDLQDNVGHGTWVASAIAGNGTEVGRTRIQGAAPNTDIINVKVLNDKGGGRISDVLTGLRKAANLGADVANLSLGAPATCATDSVICEIIDQVAQQQDMVVCAAAGNRGPDTSPHLPAQCAASVAVGSVTASGQPSKFSSRGPLCGDIVYPDVAAPGGGSNEGIIGAGPGQGLRALRGTSMATPFISGAVALMRQAAPNVSAQEVLKALELTASSTNDPNNNVGNGTARVLDAIEQVATIRGGQQPSQAGLTTLALTAGIGLTATYILTNS